MTAPACKVLQGVGANGGAAALRGRDLHVEIRSFARGERESTGAADTDGLGEEVATVLEGSFRLEVDGERYELRPSQAAIIPPGEPRTWICLDDRGVLYRVKTLHAAHAEEAS
jgi:quercetin dioxygenase-like cupin family protein